MSLRLLGFTGVSLTLLLTQTAWASAPQVSMATERDSALVVAQAAQRDPNVVDRTSDWAKARLSEIDATIAALESDARKLDADARARANAVLQSLRETREAYRTAIEGALSDSRRITEDQLAAARAALDARWSEFERGVEGYFATVNTAVVARKAVFQARLEAQQLYWRQVLVDLKSSAATFAAERRAAIETKIAELQAQADAAKARLAKIEQAGNEAWSALRDSLADERLLFDKTYDAIRAAIERAKQ